MHTKLKILYNLLLFTAFINLYLIKNMFHLKYNRIFNIPVIK